MPILHRDIAQYSEAYDRLKLGLPTSSQFKRIITPDQAKPSTQWQAYAYHLIAERLLGRKIDTYTSPAMERGLIEEQSAVDWYCWSQGFEVQPIGFITNAANTMGCTPDRLVGDTGLLEIKCPLPQTQVEYLITGKIHIAHRPQLQGQLYISQRQWVDVVAWHPELSRIVIRVERDEEFIAKLAHELDQLVKYIDTIMHRIEAAQGPPTPKQELREKLLATLEASP